MESVKLVHVPLPALVETVVMMAVEGLVVLVLLVSNVSMEFVNPVRVPLPALVETVVAMVVEDLVVLVRLAPNVSTEFVNPVRVPLPALVETVVAMVVEDLVVLVRLAPNVSMEFVNFRVPLPALVGFVVAMVVEDLVVLVRLVSNVSMEFANSIHVLPIVPVKDAEVMDVAVHVEHVQLIRPVIMVSVKVFPAPALGEVVVDQLPTVNFVGFVAMVNSVLLTILVHPLSHVDFMLYRKNLTVLLGSLIVWSVHKPCSRFQESS